MAASPPNWNDCGCDIAGPLWSAHVLDRSPAALAAVHLDYLRAGADCIATASYQISAMGYRDLGLSRRSRRRCRPARPPSVGEDRGSRTGASMQRKTRVVSGSPLLWALMEPLCTMALSTTAVTISMTMRWWPSTLTAWQFWRRPMPTSSPSKPTPSLPEAEAIVRALAQFPRLAAWISFTCPDAAHVAHGEPLQACAEWLATCPRSLADRDQLHRAPSHPSPSGRGPGAASAGSKPIIVYPNSGEAWDAATRTWHGEDNTRALARWLSPGSQPERRPLGAAAVPRPAHIAAVAQAARSVIPAAAS